MIVNQTLQCVVNQSDRREITTDMIVEAEKRETLVKKIIKECEDFPVFTWDSTHCWYDDESWEEDELWE